MDNINKPFKGLHTDNNPSEQPENTYRYALNAINETKDGEQTSLSNEGSNYSCTTIPDNYTIIGDKYMEDSTSVLFLVNRFNNRQEIGILKKDNSYETIVNTKSLNFNIANQIDATYRLRRGNERVIYWVDGLNKARSFNLDRVHNYYTQAYQNYLQAGGDPNLYTLEKWDGASFDLIKSYTKIPYFQNVQILNYGNIKPGSYNFAIQYIDEDLNPTEWINVSNTVNIYNSSLDSTYENIRGSYNVNDYQKFNEANKSIKLTIANIDDSYPYYRIAIIQANEGIGKVNKVLLSSQQSSNVGTFTYSGNDGVFEEISVNEIRIEKETLFKPKHIEQLENRLVLANTEGLNYNWCNFQKYASKVDTMLATKDVILNNIQSEPNVKNGKSTFFFRGYMPGEVYSFGIVYIMKDNSLSPVFHIPGKSSTNTVSTMEVYNSNYTYPDIHNCITNDYWGEDVMGNPLLGEKVRHHKFPSRQKSGIPLITSTNSVVNFNRYKLKIRIKLKPDKPYPLDTSDNPIIIDYQANYQITGSPVASYVNTFTQSQLGLVIEILDVTLPVGGGLTLLYPPDYTNLDPSCELITDYMIPGDEYFDIEYLPIEVTPFNSVANATQSKIYGIEFSNIEKPHPDVIGFYIVRNEVFDDDKLIIDNCIVGPNVVQDNYKAFTHITPAFPTSKFDNKSVWFFSPEVNFKQRLVQFNDIDVQGYYQTSYIQRPAQLFDTGGDPIIGVYIEDVQAGTSYNPEVHKKRDKDSDGFSLQCAYKTSLFNYYHQVLPLGKLNSAFVINAASNRLVSGNNYYNVSTDNRISMVEFSNTFDTSIFKNNNNFDISYYIRDGGHQCIVKGSRLLYASLRRGYYDSSNLWHDMEYAYQDFLTRPYYKEHMRPIFFGSSNVYNGFEVFNGDVEISGLNFLTTMFRQLKIQGRRNKTNLWKYIVGAVLIVVGIVLLAAYGTGAAVIAGGAALMAAGAFFINSGIQLDKAIAMFDEDYSKGLLKCVEDDIVVNYQSSNDTLGSGDPNYLNYEDDTIQWFCDRAANIYIESRVPFGLRAGATVNGVTDFIDGPGPYNDSVMYNYLVEKLTYFDRDQGGGRMYRGIANSEVYTCNPDYSRFNFEKSYIHLPTTYDCCNEGSILEKYPTRVWYSQQSFQEEKTDNYRNFLANNYRDIEGENGEITDLYKIGNSLFIHTNEAIWQLPQNVQERVTNELTTFIGTGDFFSIPPRKILDDNLGSGGSKHKWATIKTKFGVLFISEVENKIYIHAEGLKDVSILGMRNWFENNLKSNLSQQIFELTGEKYPFDNNPANPVGVGYLSCYDTRHERILITKKDWKVIGKVNAINGILGTSLPSLPYTYIGDELGYDTNTGKFWFGSKIEKNGIIKTFYTNIIEDFSMWSNLFENKSFTISYSFHTNNWASFHSYLPNYYIHNQGNFYSFKNGSNSIWKHNVENDFQRFYDTHFPHIIEYVSIANPSVTKTWEDITLFTTAKRWDNSKLNFVDERNITHNKVTLYNSRQSSGELTMKVKDVGNTQDYLFEQVSNNPGEILIDRNEKDWRINQLRDFVIDYTIPFFSFSWNDTKFTYPIDKIINNSVIDFNKDWTQLESFRDKYLNIRLKFDNFANINLTTQFSIENVNVSER